MAAGVITKNSLRNQNFKQFLAINKFGNFDDGNEAKDSADVGTFEDSLDSLHIEMNHLVKNSTIGFNLKNAICLNYVVENQVKVLFL